MPHVKRRIVHDLLESNTLFVCRYLLRAFQMLDGDINKTSHYLTSVEVVLASENKVHVLLFVRKVVL